jgi:hypothetical protein
LFQTEAAITDVTVVADIVAVVMCIMEPWHELMQFIPLIHLQIVMIVVV